MQKNIPNRKFLTLSKTDEEYYIEEIRCDNGEVYEDTIFKIRDYLIEEVDEKLYVILWDEQWEEGEPEYIMSKLIEFQTNTFYVPILHEMEIMYLWCEIVCGYYDHLP